MDNFEFIEEGELSLLLQESGIVSFNDACRFVVDINYARISNRFDTSLVFHERRGTCSSKHIFLKRLAEEQGRDEVKLMLGMFKMGPLSHPKLTPIFEGLSIQFVPEAHIYLSINGSICDFTSNSNFNVEEHLLEEREVDIDFVLNEKENFHKAYLKEWNTTEFSLEQLWDIRELCIAAF